MPSGEHESPIALAKLDPGLLAWLFAHVFEVKVPDYHHARAAATDVRVVAPRTYHADGMLVFCNARDDPVLAVVFEVQRGRDDSKRWTWKLYVAQLEVELEVNVALLVYCPDPAIARRYRGMFEGEGFSLALRPYIFTPTEVPLVVDVAEAEANPALAVLSAICHREDADVDTVFPALAAALRSVGPEKAILYNDIVLAGLPEAPRARWEAYVSTDTEFDFIRDYYRERDARNRAEGEAKGEGRAVLTVLDARGVCVPDDVREKILACTDLARLDTWLRRAVTATTADEVVRP